MPRMNAANIFDSMQVIDRIDRDLTPESKKELYLYVPLSSLTQNSTFYYFLLDPIQSLIANSATNQDVVMVLSAWSALRQTKSA